MPEQSAIGVDIGGTYIRAARISARGDILEWANTSTPDDPHVVTQQISELVRRLDNKHVSCIGVGIPGRVDAKHERVFSGGYVDLAEHSLAEELRGLLGRPAFIDNDGNMALAAEHAIGAATGKANVVMFTIGTGIGGAIISEHKVLRGRATAGQLGHLTVDLNGEPCLCGRRGCIETTSSGTALRRHLAEARLAEDASVQSLLDALARGDMTARMILSAWAGPMRAAIDTVVATVDPELVVLGGGLGSAMHQALIHFPAEAQWYSCPVVAAKLGDHAGVVGAGLSALASSGA
jgi:glucokinase